MKPGVQQGSEHRSLKQKGLLSHGLRKPSTNLLCLVECSRACGLSVASRTSIKLCQVPSRRQALVRHAGVPMLRSSRGGPTEHEVGASRKIEELCSLHNIFWLRFQGLNSALNLSVLISGFKVVSFGVRV